VPVAWAERALSGAVSPCGLGRGAVHFCRGERRGALSASADLLADRLTYSQNLQQQVHKKSDIKGNQEERGDPEFVATARKDICGLPVDVFGISDQQIFGGHAIV